VNHHQPQQASEDQETPVMKTGWRMVCLAVLASAWGLTELIGGETVWLTAVALFLLAIARTLVNRPGSSTAIAAVAVLFKSVNTAPFLCHLAGIILLGIAFDLAATLLWREDRKPFPRAALTGVLGSFLSCFLFAASMAWIFKFRTWPDGGLEGIGEYTLSSGGRGALTALAVVPLGLWIGQLMTRQAVGHPRMALRAAVLACLALWVIGPFAG
jgi:hypothetical protein